MAITNNMYRKAYENFWAGTFALETDSIRVALLQSGHTPDVNTHENWEDLSNEVSGGSYGTSGGKVIAHTGDKITAAGSVITFGVNAADTIWAASTITARYAVVYKFVDASDGTPHATNSKLLCIVDFDGDYTSSAGDFKLDWHADGIFKLTVNP